MSRTYQPCAALCRIAVPPHVVEDNWIEIHDILWVKVLHCGVPDNRSGHVHFIFNEYKHLELNTVQRSRSRLDDSCGYGRGFYGCGLACDFDCHHCITQTKPKQKRKILLKQCRTTVVGGSMEEDKKKTFFFKLFPSSMGGRYKVVQLYR